MTRIGMTSRFAYLELSKKMASHKLLVLSSPFTKRTRFRFYYLRENRQNGPCLNGKHQRPEFPKMVVTTCWRLRRDVDLWDLPLSIFREAFVMKEISQWVAPGVFSDTLFHLLRMLSERQSPTLSFSKDAKSNFWRKSNAMTPFELS